MDRWFLLNSVNIGLVTVVQIGAFILLLVRANGKARTYGAVGVGLSILAIVPVVLTGLVGDPTSLGFLVLSLLPKFMNLAGFVLLVSAVILGSRGVTTTETDPGGGVRPTQDYIHQNSGQNFQQWG